MPEYNPRTGQWDEPIEHTGGMFSRERIIRSKEQAAWFENLTPAQRQQCEQNEREWKEREERNYLY